MADPYTPPTIEELQQRIKVHSANARAKAANAGQTDFKAKLDSYRKGPPAITMDDVLGNVAQGSRQIVRGAVGLADLIPAAVVGAGNIPDTFWNASHPYSPQRPIPTPQEFFGKPGEPAMMPTDLVDKYLPTIPGHEHDILNTPLEVGGALLGSGGFNGITAGGRAAAIADARAGAVLPSLRAAPVVDPGILPTAGRALATGGRAAGRAVTRTGVTTGGMFAGQQAGGAVGRGIAEAVGGPQYGDLGEHYGSQAGAIITPGAIDAARVPFYDTMNYVYAKPGGANVVGSSAHTLQAMRDVGIPVDAGTALNAPASNLLDFTAGLPGAGGPAMRTRADLYGDSEQNIINAAAYRRAQATGGPPATGVGRNIDEVSIGGRAIDAAINARGTPVEGGAPSRGIHAGLETVYNDPVTGLHRNDPVTGQPILGRDTPIAVQTEHQAYNDILADPRTAQAVADPAIGVVRGELTDSSNLIVDPALQARLEAEHADLLYRRQGVNYPPTLERIDQELTANAAAQAANRGPSFQAQRDLRTRGRNRGGIDVLGERVGDASYAAKTATMRQAAADRGLAGVFDATETEASRLLRQRDALKELLPNDNNVRPTGQEGFNSLFSKSGAGDLEQLGALLEHAPAETGQAFADRFELAGRGKVSAGTQDVNPAAYDPSRIVQLWDNASPEARDAYAPPGTPLRRYVEAQVAVNRADTLRTAARTKPGRGSNTLGGPQRFFTNPLTLATGGAAAGALSFGVPGLGALVGLLPSATARFFGSRLTDPRFVERIIHPPTVGESLSLPRILGAAVGEQDPNRDPRKLLNTAGTAAGRAARYPYP